MASPSAANRPWAALWGSGDDGRLSSPDRLVRQEFPAAVKRAALERSGGQCEAVGERYNLPAGVRCQNRVGVGMVQYDHYPQTGPRS